MPSDATDVRPREFCAENPNSGSAIDGLVFTGSGQAVIQAIARETNRDGVDVLSEVINGLLVNKGADWTAPILSEYVGVYEDSLGTFCLVLDRKTNRLAAHGSIFQSRAQPWAALLAHIRTRDEYRGLGLGTLVTQEVTAGAFSHGAEVVILATDDKINRIDQGERAAHSMYSRMGYAILGEARLADTIDWLMVINRPLLEARQQSQTSFGGRFADEPDQAIQDDKAQLVQTTRDRFTRLRGGMIDPVSPGDLAGLFLLLNLCPADDYRLKLTSWQVHHGAEAERTFLATLRQAIVDRDRLQDASLVMRDADGVAVAVCAAQQQAPFTRQTFAIDFYCLPALLESARDAVVDLVQRTIERINNAPDRPRPCRLSFIGADPSKAKLFESLGFQASDATVDYYGPDGQVGVTGREYVRVLE